jgi:hypothetical protein
LLYLHLYLYLFILPAYTTYEDGKECSEKLKLKNQRPGSNPKEIMQQKETLLPEARKASELGWTFRKRGNFLFSAKVRNPNGIARYLMRNKFQFVAGISGYKDSL